MSYTARVCAPQGKNREVEIAVDDLVHVIASYPLDSHIEPVSLDEINKLRMHYNHFMFQVLPSQCRW